MKLTVFVLMSLCVIGSAQIPANPALEEWAFDDPRWETLIPNWWDHENFQPPSGPEVESTKEFWYQNADNILKKKLSYKPNINRAKNLILFIGDGMGLSSQMAARSYIYDVATELSFEKFPVAGLAKTYCVNYQVGDSTCTATALLSGVKTNYMVSGLTAAVNLRNCTASLDPQTHAPSIMKYAQEAGKATGFVTTTRLTHNTPAGVYAQAASRNWEASVDSEGKCQDIATQLIHGEVGKKLDVAMGGGRRYLRPTGEGGRRTDGRNLLNEFLQVAALSNKKAALVQDRQQLLAVDSAKTDKILGCFAESHMAYKIKANPTTQPTLLEMTGKALEIMSKNKNGYVLMVEGGNIDVAHHGNTAKAALQEVVEFHKTIEFVKKHTNEKDTLIVVTADHGVPFTIGGYLPRFRNILGPGDYSVEDNKWVFSASYANGVGYFRHAKPGGGRKDPRGMNYMSADFEQPATLPMDSTTHSGEDVGVYASGPFEHLFTGTFEQHFIPHAMMYAACFGPGAAKHPACGNARNQPQTVTQPKPAAVPVHSKQALPVVPQQAIPVVPQQAIPVVPQEAIPVVPQTGTFQFQLPQNN